MKANNFEIPKELHEQLGQMTNSLNAVVKNMPKYLDQIKSNLPPEEVEKIDEYMKQADMRGKFDELTRVKADFDNFIKKYK